MAISVYEVSQGICLNCRSSGAVTVIRLGDLEDSTDINLCRNCKGQVSNLLIKDETEKDTKDLIVNIGMDYAAESISRYGIILSDEALEKISTEAAQKMISSIDESIKVFLNQLSGGLQ